LDDNDDKHAIIYGFIISLSHFYTHVAAKQTWNTYQGLLSTGIYTSGSEDDLSLWESGFPVGAILSNFDTRDDKGDF
jgi:hypothetical protein